MGHRRTAGPQGAGFRLQPVAWCGAWCRSARRERVPALRTGFGRGLFSTGGGTCPLQSVRALSTMLALRAKARSGTLHPSRPTTLTAMLCKTSCLVDRPFRCGPKITKLSLSGWVLPLLVATPVTAATAAAVRARSPMTTIMVVTPGALGEGFPMSPRGLDVAALRQAPVNAEPDNMSIGVGLH